MDRIFMSLTRVWLVLALLLAGSVVATAQTGGLSDILSTGQSERKAEEKAEENTVKPRAGQPAKAQAETGDEVLAEQAAKSRADPAVAEAALPAGITEAAGKARRVAADISKTLEDLKGKLADPSLPAGELAEAREQLEIVRERAKLVDLELTSPLAQMEAQVSRLGPAPKDGETEPETVATQRAELERVRGVLLGARAELALAAGAADQLASQAGQLERTRYFDRLFKHEKSILAPSLWTEGIARAPDIWARTTRLANGYYTLIAENNGAWMAWLLLVAFVVLAAGGYHACRALAHRVRAGRAPNGELGKLVRVVATPVGYALIAVVTTAVFGLLLFQLGAESPRIEQIYWAFAMMMVMFAFTRGLARSILSPTRPDWRIANLSSQAAQKWLNLLTISLVVMAVAYLVNQLLLVVNLSEEMQPLRRAIVLPALMIIIVRLILVAQRDRRSSDGAQGKPAYFSWASYLIQPIWLLVIATGLALITGYLTLASYMIANVVVIGTAVSFLYCIRRLADAFVAQSISEGSRISNTLKHTFSMSEQGIKRAGIALNAFVDFTLLLLGLPLLLTLTALSWVDVRSWFSTAFFGFDIGDITISLSSILLAIGVFAIGLLLTRLITGWLDRRILSATNLDAGVRNSIRTGASYTATILALLVAFAAAGVNFGNIAIVAGALSVGIGFGLQSIVNNFVSGLILLAERPIKVGDWVSVTAGEGTVTKINVRATEIETFDRCSIIVPNSSLISDAVQNWTHGDLMGRCKVLVGVSYDADPQQVHDILVRCAEDHPRAMAYPLPSVLFKDFGASSLDFEVRVFINDVNWVAFVASELRFSIHKALKEAGIEIPFPQRDINVRGFQEAVAEAVRAEAKAESKLKPKG
jgi:small-conductance mechanosensitive channel